GLSESVVDTTAAIILILNKQGDIIRCNPYMEELSGYTLEEVKGKNWFETFLPKSIEDIQTCGNVPILTKDGRELLIEWRDRTLKNNDEIVGLLLTGQDITEREMSRKKLEQMIEFSLTMSDYIKIEMLVD
ncbi:PAS domain protein, partial [Candidatus Magnetobacterium bavaricum]